MKTKIIEFTRRDERLRFSESFPYYADLDLGAVYRLQRMEISGIEAREYAVRWYGSRDGLNFSRIPYTSGEEVPDTRTSVFRPAEDTVCRVLRVQIPDSPWYPQEWATRIRIEAEETGEPFEEAADPLETVLTWKESGMDYPPTAAETEAYLAGLAERVIGKEHARQFAFRLITEDGNDRYRVCTGDSGSAPRILIEGTSGVAMAAGLYRYLRELCHAHISEQEKQVSLPTELPVPEGEMTGTAQDRIRYANNYCTLSYTMPFWDEEDWQRELDWWALSGVNVILDFTGIEAVWILFLRKMGCSDRDIGDWITGPCYTAWQQMQNIQGIGGPVHRGFLADRVRLARINQRKMRILGISPVRQGYAGMLPDFCRKAKPELSLFSQGTWCGISRPSMLDPSSAAFYGIADLFYQCQDAVFGTWSPFYAVDPYHEGGSRPQKLTDGEMGRRVMRAMLRHDPRAIWVLQAWRDNPSRGLLAGLTPEERREHLMILDLSSTDNYLGGEDEFMGTPWVYCMLDMYGGRVSTHGEADVLARIPERRRECQYMAGIGSAAEATHHNPVVFELLYETAWHQNPIDAESWIRDYARRRYGGTTPETERAWSILLKTAYHDPECSHHGGYTQMFTYRPRLTMHPAPILNELNSEIIKLPYYAPREFYGAVEALAAAWEPFREKPCFLYDLQDLLRQALNLAGTRLALAALQAYRDRDPEAFGQRSEAFLQLLEACDALMRTRKDTLLAAWSGRAAEAGKQYDDFTEDLFAMNARALITTWGYRDTYRSLADYAYRQYGGLLEAFYSSRWRLWFARLREALEEGREAVDISMEEWFRHDWAFVMNGTEGEKEQKTEKPEKVFPWVVELIRKNKEWL